MKRPKGICHNKRFDPYVFVIFFYIIFCNTAFANSKHTFPNIEEKDLPYFLNKQEKVPVPNVYLYSSLSFISLEKDSIEFNLTKGQEKSYIPISSISVQPLIDSHIQSEYFDFTIWGHLGNYFNKKIEYVELENKISSIFKELEEINKKYKSLFANKPFQFKSEHIITISKHDYFSDYKDKNKGEEQGVDLIISKNINNPYELNTFLKKYVLKPQSKKPERELFSERVLTLGLGIKGLKGNQNVASNYNSKKKNSISSEGYTWINSLFNIFNRVLIYFVNNKIESSIYLVLLYFVISIIIRIFTRK